MATWSVAVDAVVTQPVTDRQVEALHVELEAHLASVGLDGALVVAQMTVEAGTLRQAFDAGVRAFTRATRDVGVRCAVDSVTVKTWERFEADLEQPAVPELVGLAEIGEMLGVTRQRAQQLAAKKQLPPPVADLRAGPVFVKAAVERFEHRWERKRTGRPPKNA